MVGATYSTLTWQCPAASLTNPASPTSLTTSSRKLKALYMTFRRTCKVYTDIRLQFRLRLLMRHLVVMHGDASHYRKPPVWRRPTM